MNKRIESAIRWIILLPVSFFITPVIKEIWYGFNYFFLCPNIGIDPDSTISQIYSAVISNIIFGYTFVYLAYLIAPKFKKQIALLMAIVALILFGSSLYAINFITKDYPANVGSISAIIGVIASYFEIKKKEAVRNNNLIESDKKLTSFQKLVNQRTEHYRKEFNSNPEWQALKKRHRIE